MGAEMLNAREFLASLARVLPEAWAPGAPRSWLKWTEHMVERLHIVAAGAGMSCVCQHGHPPESTLPNATREVLFDMCWFADKADYALPAVVIEHENSSDERAFLFDMWKLMFAQAPLRVMIGYAPSLARRSEYGALVNRVAAESHWNFPAGSEDVVLVGTDMMPTPRSFAVFVRAAGETSFRSAGQLG
jgi:hypothetical protein